MRHGGSQQLTVQHARQHDIVGKFRLAGTFCPPVDAAAKVRGWSLLDLAARGIRRRVEQRPIRREAGFHRFVIYNRREMKRISAIDFPLRDGSQTRCGSAAWGSARAILVCAAFHASSASRSRKAASVKIGYSLFVAGRRREILIVRQKIVRGFAGCKKAIYFVIRNEVRNRSLFYMQKRKIPRRTPRLGSP